MQHGIEVCMLHLRNNANVSIAEITPVERYTSADSVLREIYIVQRQLGIGIALVRRNIYQAFATEKDVSSFQDLGSQGIQGMAMHVHGGVVLDIESSNGLVSSSVEDSAIATADVLDQKIPDSFRHYPWPYGIPDARTRLRSVHTNTQCQGLLNIRSIADYQDEFHLPVDVQRLLTERGQIVTVPYRKHLVLLAHQQPHGRNGRTTIEDTRVAEGARYAPLSLR